MSFDLPEEEEARRLLEPVSPEEVEQLEEDAEGRITLAVARVDELRPELEDLRRDVVEAAVRWVVDWWEAEARRAITDDPFISLDRLGPEGIKRLRERCRDLAERGPELVRERLARSELWVHRASIDQLVERAARGSEAFERPYQLKGHGVQPVEDELRRLAGELGPHLVEAGVARWHQAGSGNTGPWRRPSETGGVRYMRTLDYPAYLERTLKAYAHRAVALYDAVSQVQELRRAKAVAEATRYWDEA